MSNQPKPTTGEWTRQWGDIMCNGKLVAAGLSVDQAKLIIAAHNAQLAAVCKVSQDSQKALWEATKQLAAERERPCSWCESERDEVLQQLAAEQEKVQVAGQGLKIAADTIKQLREQKVK